MNGLKLSFAVVAFVLVQGIGVIWYVSKLDSRVDQMYKSFEEEKEIMNQFIIDKDGKVKPNKGYYKGPYKPKPDTKPEYFKGPYKPKKKTKPKYYLT